MEHLDDTLVDTRFTHFFSCKLIVILSIIINNIDCHLSFICISFVMIPIYNNNILITLYSDNKIDEKTSDIYQ